MFVIPASKPESIHFKAAKPVRRFSWGSGFYEAINIA